MMILNNSLKIWMLLLSFLPIKIQANALTAEPFGLELGAVTYEETKSRLSGKTTLVDGGLNVYTAGPMLKSNGHGLGIENLQEVTFIFDRDKTLAAVLLVLPKGRMDHQVFKSMLSSLKAKYKLQEQRIPFVGNAYARLNASNATIELDAPHMGFIMEVRYATPSFLRSFALINDAEKKETKGRTARQL